MGWRLFKATDPGAPSAALNVTGQLTAVLRACLIDGYGTGEDYKAPVGGWEEPWPESNGVAVFRATTGNRQFYQIQDSTAGVVPFRAYESMTDVNTGVGNWVTSQASNIGKYYSTATMDWMVLANDRTILFFSIMQYGWGFTCFGEYESFFEGDPYNDCFIGFGNYARYNYSPAGTPLAIAAPSYGAHIHRIHDGTGLGAWVGLQTMGFQSVLPNVAAASVAWEELVPTKKILFSPCLFMSALDTTSAPSGSPMYGRFMCFGRLPLVLTMDVSVLSLTDPINHTKVWVDPSTLKEYLIIGTGITVVTTSYRGCIAIPLEDVS